jgi:hypothetical protein
MSLLTVDKSRENMSVFSRWLSGKRAEPIDNKTPYHGKTLKL